VLFDVIGHMADANEQGFRRMMAVQTQ
jgi:hypothetical protein